MERLIRNIGINLKDRLAADPEGKCSLSPRRSPEITLAGPLRALRHLASASGVIVDTPSSFASGPTSNDHRLRLIKACIEAFRSMSLQLTHQMTSKRRSRQSTSLLSLDTKSCTSRCNEHMGQP